MLERKIIKKMKRAEIELDNNTQGNQSYIDLFASDDTKFDRLDPILNNDTILILFGDSIMQEALTETSLLN